MNTFANYQTDILAKWQTAKMHTLYERQRANIFNFIDGPPFVSGKLHFGHLAVGSIKSTILNFKSMTGYNCLNKLGYDCHGLPIESIANQELEINSLEELEKIGIQKFNAFCKDKIRSFEGEWEPIYNRIGRWANFNNVYKTMDKEFMESVWWAFSELYSKGLIYRGYKITPYSYSLQSPLSNFEASQNYKEVDCRSAYVRFIIKNTDKLNLEEKYSSMNSYLIAWTTTPWTLPANLALCVNSTLEYDIIKTETNELYILGKGTYKNAGVKPTEIIKTILGKELIGLEYIPLFNTYNNLEYNNLELNNYSSRWFKVVEDNYVKESNGSGTSIVHLAPVFGEDDYRVCKEKGLITESLVPQLEIIDKNCKYLPSVGNKYSGVLVFDTETDIIKDLKQSQTLVKIQQIRHEYPYCYRTDTPLVYRTCESFYVDVQKIKTRMIELNSSVNWFPDFVGKQRFHKWLEGASDWCISRSRYFGTPIPVWISEDGLDIHVIGSIKELEELTGVSFNDIHPEFVNTTSFSINGKVYHRVPDIFDCWFESGSVPFAQYHYPFQNKAFVDNQVATGVMCDFIAEGLDQTRGWFYTLLVLSTALFNVAPARNIMTVGLILDEHKKKLSKKNKNYIDPNVLIDNYGADSIRLYLLQSPITMAEPLAFKEMDIALVNKDLFQFKNCVDFLNEHITNMKHNKIKFDSIAYQRTENAMDKWIIYHINNSTLLVNELMNNYQIAKATRTIMDLIEDITNWYLKFNRDRLKGKDGIEEWYISSSVLYQIIKKFIILLAPFAPFLSQFIYDELNTFSSNTYSKVHEETYDELIPIPVDNNHLPVLQNSENIYLQTFDLLKRVSRMVRAARMKTTTHTSNKTPIKSCEICMDSPTQLEMISSCIDLIQSELNIVDIKYSKLTGNLNYLIRGNKALLGKKYKKNANTICKVLEEVSQSCIDDYGRVKILIGEDEYLITKEEYTLEPVFNENDIYDIQPEGNILTKIDFTYDSDIEKLSILKRFVAEVQQTRKHMGLRPWNKISIEIVHDDFNVVSCNMDYIKKRLECDVNPNSTLSADKIFKPLEDDSRVIKYFVLVL